MKSKLTKAGKLIIAGTAMIPLALFLRYVVISQYVTAEITKKLVLEPGNEIWDVWTDIPIPIYSKFFFFNVTNADDIVNGQKPIVKEVGPYVYQEHRMKVILNVNEETVKYRPRTSWYFRPELSFGSENDKITLLNIPFVGISKMAWDMSKQPYVLSTLDDMLVEKGERVFQTNEVKDLLFDGIPIDNYMELLSLPVTNLFGDDAKKKIPERLLDGDFGFFDDRNGTADDIWIVKTGKGNPSDFGRIVSWNGQTKLKVWDNDVCDEIRGTDGSIFPPFAAPDDILHVFTSDLCRSLQMKYLRDSEYHGLPTMLYTFGPSTFGSLKDFPENECYCKDAYAHCMKGGVMPLGKCQGGAPLFLSHPHFMNGHPDYKNGVDGLQVGKGDFQSYLHLDKSAGIVIGATFRLQMNIELQPYDAMSAFTNVPNVMFPLMWIEQTAMATDELLGSVKTLALFVKAVKIGTSSALIHSFVFILIGIILHAKDNNWDIGRMMSSGFRNPAAH